jgi:hypothetical protein
MADFVRLVPAKPGHDSCWGLRVKYVYIFGAWYYVAIRADKTTDGRAKRI